MFRTRMTELLGCRYPIQCGTMRWLSRAELVAAVVEAGGFACLSAATFATKDELRAEIRKVRDMTSKPFGVNVSLLPSSGFMPHEEQIEVAVEEGVEIIETSAHNPEPYRKMIAEAGLIHIHKCARVKDAKKAERIGCDAVTIVGTECGGHPGMGGVTTLVLLPLTVDAVDIPVLAGGGFCDGRSMMAAFALGAEGVVMGTRFIASEECMAHKRIKDMITSATEADTVLIRRPTGNPLRVLKNRAAIEVLERENTGASSEELSLFTVEERSKKAWIEGNADNVLLPAGQVAARIREVLSVRDIMIRTIEQAKEVLHHFGEITKLDKE